MTICDLKQKEVINIKDCKRLGFVGDVDIIPFCDICQVGNDIILVDVKEKNVEEKVKC